MQGDTGMKQVWFTYLNGSDIAQLELTDDEILDAVEEGLRGHVAPLSPAGVKIVGDFVGDHRAGPPSEMEERGLGQKLRFS
jgi:alanine dehydrogenase